MAHENDAVYLGHMLDMTRRAVKAIKTKSRAKYDKDDILRLGLTHLVQVIGEAARKVSARFQRKHPEIPCGKSLGCGIASCMITCVWMKIYYGR